jgi:hypothetical protein
MPPRTEAALVMVYCWQQVGRCPAAGEIGYLIFHGAGQFCHRRLPVCCVARWARRLKPQTPSRDVYNVRQGCPLSTTLFNLFIWDLHAKLAQTGASAKMPCAPTEQGRAVQTLLSDMATLTITPCVQAATLSCSAC